MWRIYQSLHGDVLAVEFAMPSAIKIFNMYVGGFFFPSRKYNISLHMNVYNNIYIAAFRNFKGDVVVSNHTLNAVQFYPICVAYSWVIRPSRFYDGDSYKHKTVVFFNWGLDMDDAKADHWSTQLQTPVCI